MASETTKILIVDDEKRVRDILTHFLTEAGYDVDSVDNAASALDRMSTGEYTLLVLDIVMPEMDGLSFCAELKKDPTTADIPVLFLSAHVEIPDLFLDHYRGSGGFLQKPFRKDELLEKVRGLLGSPRE